MSEMTDIEKQRGKEYTKEELFEALSAAKKEASAKQAVLDSQILMYIKLEAERDRYRKILEIVCDLGWAGDHDFDSLIEAALSAKGE